MPQQISAYPGTVTRAHLQCCIPHLRAFAMILTGNRAAADDLAAAVLLRTVEDGRKLPALATLLPWLFTMAHIIHFGIPANHRAHAAPEGRSGRGHQGPADPMVHAFWALRDDQREILILDHASGLSRTDMALVLGYAVGMIGIKSSLAANRLVNGLSQPVQVDRELA
jgi:RNA polymerase sigma-70 factor (ECF subfamily)